MDVSDANEAADSIPIVLNRRFKTAVVKLRCGVFMGFPGKRENNGVLLECD